MGTTKHGMHGSPEYRAWQAMRQRCSNKNEQGYAHYGARGIQVCDRWQRFENFFADMGWRPSVGWSIERVDNNKGYQPDNCRWITDAEQTRNRRMMKNNTSGATGVTWRADRNKWEVFVSRKYLGSFSQFDAAFEARETEKLKRGFAASHGLPQSPPKESPV